MNGPWLYEKVNRVPEITDDQIAEMRHIEPVLEVVRSGMYQRIRGIKHIDPRATSFLWDAQPIGEEFTADVRNQSKIITQHRSAVFFKPSLAEVYAWIRVYLGSQWDSVKFFCLHEPQRIGGSSDMWCFCTLMTDRLLVKGNEIVCPSGARGYELVEAESIASRKERGV